MITIYVEVSFVLKEPKEAAVQLVSRGFTMLSAFSKIK